MTTTQVEAYTVEVENMLTHAVKSFIPSELSAPYFKTSTGEVNSKIWDMMKEDTSGTTDYSKIPTTNLSKVYYRLKTENEFRVWTFTSVQEVSADEDAPSSFIDDNVDKIAEIMFPDLSGTLKTDITELRQVYSIIREFPKLMTATQMEVPVYGSMNTSTNTVNTVVVDNTLLDTLSTNILDINTLKTDERILHQTDLFGIARLLLMFDKMFHVRVALQKYKAATAADKPIAEAVLIGCIYQLLEIHAEFVKKTSVVAGEGGVQEIYGGYIQNIAKYDEQNAIIAELDTSIRDQQSTLRTNVDLINDKEALQKKRRVMEIIALVFAGIIIVGCVSLVVVPMPQHTKVMAAGGFFAISILCALLLRFLPTFKSVEGFESQATLNPILNKLAQRTTDTDKSVANYQAVALVYTAAILTDTLLLSSMLTGKKAYDNLNFAMLREVNQYSGIDQRLRGTNQKTSNLERIMDLENHKLKSTAYFSVNLMIIVSTTVVLYIAAEPMPQVQPYVLAIGVAVGLISMMLYLIDILRRVRTDGDKIYWGAPVYKK